MILIPLLLFFLYILYCCHCIKTFYEKKKQTKSNIFSYFIKDYLIMSDKKQEEQRPLGAVLGWLNLSPTLPNNQDNMTGATAGLFIK